MDSITKDLIEDTFLSQFEDFSFEQRIVSYGKVKITCKVMPLSKSVWFTDQDGRNWSSLRAAVHNNNCFEQ